MKTTEIKLTLSIFFICFQLMVYALVAIASIPLIVVLKLQDKIKQQFTSFQEVEV